MSERTYKDKPVIAVLLGDAAGIGPEIVAKVAASGFLSEHCYPVIIGDLRVLQLGMKIAGVDFTCSRIENVDEADWSKGMPVLDQTNLDPGEIKLGEVSPVSGRVTGDLLITAVNLYNEGKIEGICFAPLNKGAMKRGGHNFESEDYLFAHYFNWCGHFGEVNALENIFTTRVTSHIPVKEISSNLTTEGIYKAINLAYSTVKSAGVENPRIAVTALNPHAGEEGLCGREEIDVIKPAIELARREGINTMGPYSADVLFIKAFNGEFDAVVTMYHDQGQIALKLRGFEHGVTILGGFPAPITTPAHGTAFDIAGRGIAKTTAFENALKIAVKMGNSKRQ